jgi:hypothetical protein
MAMEIIVDCPDCKKKLKITLDVSVIDTSVIDTSSSEDPPFPYNPETDSLELSWNVDPSETDKSTSKSLGIPDYDVEI